MKRREFLGTSAIGAAGLLHWPVSGRAQDAVSEAAIANLTRGAPMTRSRVKLELPVIADNGNAVPIRVSVASPMTETDYVRAIHLVSDRNPVRNMASFFLGPYSGRAELVMRVRLAGSQNVTAIAETSDGRFWMDRSHVQVTLSACVDES